MAGGKHAPAEYNTAMGLVYSGAGAFTLRFLTATRVRITATCQMLHRAASFPPGGTKANHDDDAPCSSTVAKFELRSIFKTDNHSAACPTVAIGKAGTEGKATLTCNGGDGSPYDTDYYGEAEMSKIQKKQALLPEGQRGEVNVFRRRGQASIFGELYGMNFCEGKKFEDEDIKLFKFGNYPNKGNAVILQISALPAGAEVGSAVTQSRVVGGGAVIAKGTLLRAAQAGDTAITVLLDVSGTYGSCSVPCKFSSDEKDDLTVRVHEMGAVACTDVDARVITFPGLDARFAPKIEVPTGSHIFCALKKTRRQACYAFKYLEDLSKLENGAIVTIIL
jgi:hypothetical protein